MQRTLVMYHTFNLGIAVIVSVAAAPNPKAAVADGGGHWEPLPHMRVSRSRAAVAQLGGSVFVFGGYAGAAFGDPTDLVERFDLRTGSWSLVSPMPVGRYDMAVAVLDGKAYLIGGLTTGFTEMNRVSVYDPVTDSWTTAPSLPSPIGGACATALGERIYVFGGRGVHGASTHIFSESTGWNRGEDMPTRRSLASAVTVGPFIYVLGGDPVRDANERYDPTHDEWAVLAPMPTARHSSATAFLNGRIYAFGGAGSTVLRTNESYCLLTDTWSSGPPLPEARMLTMAAALRNSIMIPGGENYPVLMSDVIAFVPEACAGAEPYCLCTFDAPCGNTSAGGGCTNATGAGGRLTGSGTASLAADDLVLVGDDVPVDTPGVAFTGSASIRVPFGDGQLCVIAGVRGLYRFGPQASSSNGSFQLGPGIVSQSSHAITIAAGSTWNFQFVFRDPLGPCGYGFNTTNALAVTWAP